MEKLAKFVGCVTLCCLSIAAGFTPLVVFNKFWPWTPAHAAAHEFISFCLFVWQVLAITWVADIITRLYASGPPTKD
jgi:hypothetical protein